jgi:hypothetical protein
LITKQSNNHNEQKFSDPHPLTVVLTENRYEHDKELEPKMSTFVELLRESANRLSNDVQINFLFPDSLTFNTEQAVVIARKEAWFTISNILSVDKKSK